MQHRVAPRLPLVSFLEARSRLERRLTAAVAALLVLWLALRATARTLLDRWWLDTVTEAPVWSRRTAAQLQLGFGTGAFVALVLGGSVWLVLRTARLDHGRRHRLWERYEERVGPAHRWMLILLTAYLVWHIGRAAAGEWQSWLLFRFGGDVGVDVPELDGDLGFHLFRLPLLMTASSFLRQLFLVAIAVAVFGHAASGALRLPGSDRRSSPVAVYHLVILTVGFLALQALHQVVVARAATATNRTGAFDGPGFTEVEVTRPALQIAAVTCVALGFGVIWAARRGRWRPVAIAAVAVAAGQLVLLVIAPTLSERLLVAPAEAQRQLWSIDHNLDATRTAYGLSDIEPRARQITEGIDRVDLRGAGGAAGAVPLFAARQIASALQVLVGTPGTRIADADLEPYLDGDSVRPIYAAARSASRVDLPERGWVQEHLVYTHGDGIVTLAADVVDTDGRPDLTPVAGRDQVTHAPLYFGEGLDGWYAIVGTKRDEYDGRSYVGEGVPLGSAARRMVLSLATGEPEPLLTNEVGDHAVLLYRRGLTERIGAIAPFLTLDSDPYPVVNDDHVVWIVDGYTTSSTYPYAQFLPTGEPAGTALAQSEQNFIRASVKVTVDAVDGAVHLYRTDDGDDPVVAAWDRILPDLFEPIDAMPQALLDQLRFPNDLFAVQTAMLGRYHVDDAEKLFNGADRWSVSAAAASTVGEQTSGPAPAADVTTDGGLVAVRPYGPGAADNPTSTRDELASFAIGTHGRASTLELVVPDSGTLLSPQVAQSAIDADPELAQAITLLNANGSLVEFGPMTPVLLGDGLAWARPITVKGTSAASVPRLYGVAVVSGGLVGLGPSVEDALAAIDQASAE